MTQPWELGAPVPESIGRTADLYHDVRELRLAMQKEVEAVEAREAELRDSIINRLSASDDTGAAGLRYRAQIVPKVKPKIADWPTLTKWLQESGRFDMLQKRLSDKAVTDVWDDGYAVPGVEKINVKDVSITKV